MNMCTSSSSMDSDEPEKAVIQKVPSIDRVRDQGGYRHRAAALCCRVFNQSTPGNEIEILLVSGRNSYKMPKYWVFPGGGVEEMENSEEAVVRELREEAGIFGRVVEPIGTFWDEERCHKTEFYLLTIVEILDDWEELRNGRERRWMLIKEAIECIKDSQLPMLERGISIVNRTMLTDNRYQLFPCH